MTFLMGPAPCRDCRAQVSVVRRTFVFMCASHGRLCTSLAIQPTVVEEDGSTHICPCEQAFGSWYDGTDGSSVIKSDTIGDGRAPARPRSAAVPCLEV